MASRYAQDRSARLQLLLQELRQQIAPPPLEKASALALRDRINLEANSKAEGDNDRILREFDGLLEKLLTTGGRMQQAMILEEKKNAFVRSHRKYNSGFTSTSKGSNQCTTDTKMLQLLMLLSQSPTRADYQNIAWPVPASASAAAAVEDSSGDGSGNALDEASASASARAGLDDWVDAFEEEEEEEDQRWGSDSDSEEEGEDEEDAGGLDEDASCISWDSRSQAAEGLAGSAGTWAGGPSSAYRDEDKDKEKERRESTKAAVFATNLHFGAHISQYAVSPEELCGTYADIYSLRSPAGHASTSVSPATVFLQFDVCKMAAEMLLGSHNDLFERREINWIGVFSIATSSAVQRKQNSNSASAAAITAIPDLRSTCRAFSLTHFAQHMRLPNVGPAALRAAMYWFCEIGSDMHICQQFATFREEQGQHTQQSIRSDDAPMKKLVEGLQAQVLESLSHMTADVVAYQKRLMEECSELFGDEYEHRRTQNLATFRPLLTPERRCTLISLYAMTQKWRRALHSLVSFIQTVLEFIQFQRQRHLQQRHHGAAATSPSRSASNELLRDFYMPFKLIECTQAGVRANSFDMSNSPVVLFKHEHESRQVSDSFALRRFRYQTPGSSGARGVRGRKATASSILSSFAVFERFALIHFVHYFVESCSKSNSFVRDQNYLLKASDVFSKAHSTFMASHRGGFMKMVLPNLVLLDTHYELENKSIARFSKIHGASNISWREEIKKIKKLEDYAALRNRDIDSSKTAIAKRFLSDTEVVQLMRRVMGMKDLQEKGEMFKYLYTAEYLQSIEHSLRTFDSSGDSGSARAAQQFAATVGHSTTVSDVFDIVPTLNLHVALLINPILRARREGQAIVARSVWQSFQLDAYFEFFRDVFLMGNHELFSGVKELTQHVMNMHAHPDVLLQQASHVNRLTGVLTQVLATISPKVGVLHLSVSAPIHRSTLTGSAFLFQVVESLSVQLHLSYPLGDLFTDEMLAQYSAMLTFLLRLAVSEWVLKLAWSEGGTGRNSRVFLVKSIRAKKRMEDVSVAEINGTDAHEDVDDESWGREERKKDDIAAFNAAVQASKDWFAFLNKSRLALGLVLRICTDTRAYFLTMVHSIIWTKFEKAMYLKREGTDTDTNSNATADAAAHELRLASVEEIKQCHARMLSSLCQNKDQFGEVLSTFLLRAVSFAEALLNAAQDEASLPQRIRGLPAPNTQGAHNRGAAFRAQPNQKQLAQLRRNADDHRAILDTRLKALEDALVVFRACMDQLIKSERANHVLDGIRELRNMLG